MKFETENKISTAEFLRAIADRASFNYNDAKIFWKFFQEVFEEVVATKSELYLGKLGHLHYTTTKERILPDPMASRNGETVLIHRPASIRPIFSLSMPLKEIVRGKTGDLPWKRIKENLEGEELDE